MNKGFIPIFLIAFLFMNAIAIAQTGNIHGYVKEAESGDAMIGASVFILGTSTGTVTDFNGEFTLNGIKVGEVTLEFSYLGFTTLTQTTALEKGQTQEIDVAMEYEAVKLLDQDIVVTAQASAQMAAINKQRSSTTIANVISVKRIQELPDANAAEVVGRLPGVSLVRSGGEGAKVVVRGLSPKYNKVTLEGVKMASTGGNDRSSDMSMISPFMLEGIEVFKAALPDKEADAHGGTINFVLKEAPDKFQLNAYLSGGASLISKTGLDGKVVLGMSNRFFNKKLGVFVQADYEKRNRTSHTLYASYSPIAPGEIDSDIRGTIIALKDINRDIDRKGGAIVLDYKIPNGSIKFSNFGSSITKDYTNLTEAYGLLYLEHFHQLDFSKNDLLIATNALSINKTMGPFKVTLKASRAYSKNDSPRSISIVGKEPAAFEDEVNLKAQVNDILKYAKNNYNNTRLERIDHRTAFSKEEEYSYGGDVEFANSISKTLSFTVKVGGKFKQLTKEHERSSENIPISWGSHGAPFRAAVSDYYGIGSSSLVPYAPFINQDYPSSNFLQGSHPFSGPMDLEKGAQLAKIAEDGNYYLKHYPTDKMFDYHGNEEYMAGYVMAKFKYKKLITLTPGVRYENNKTTYTGVRGDQTILDEYVGYRYTEKTTSRENSFILPMVHLKVNPLKWLNIRMAYTQTLARPDFTQIVPSWNIRTTETSWNNPYLTPSKSTNLDFYVSAYKSKLGLVSIGAFSKSIKDLIFNAGLSYINDPAIYGLPGTQKGRKVTRIINNKFPLTIWGVESEYKTRFWYLDNFLKGVVLNLNYTHIFSKVKYPITIIKQKLINEPPYSIKTNIDTFYTDRFIDQPNDIFNATVGYDFKGFSARVSYLYRTKIFSRTEFWTGLRGNSDNYSRWDISLKQDLPKGFEVMVNFANVFAKPERDRLVKSGYIVNEQHYGTTIDVGLRYRFH